MMLKLEGPTVKVLKLGGLTVKSSKKVFSKHDPGERLSILLYLGEM